MTAALIATLHSPRRRELLRLCWAEPQRAGDLYRALGDVTFGAVSQHLKKLHQAGLVAVEHRGRERLYRTVRTALGPLRRWLETSWDDALYELRLQAELEAARRGPRPASPTSPRARKASR